MSGARVHKSLRVDAGLDARVRAQALDGESDAAAYSRVIEAGLSAMEGRRGDESGHAADDGGQAATGVQDGGNAASDGATGPLAATIEALRAQLDAKDGQIAALTDLLGRSQDIASRAQALQAVTAKAVPAAGEGDGKRRRGLMARLFGREKR